MLPLSEIKQLAIVALVNVARNKKASGAARAAAARTLLEMEGAVGRLQRQKPGNNVDLHSLTREQLESEIRRLSGALGESTQLPAENVIKINGLRGKSHPSRRDGPPKA